MYKYKNLISQIANLEKKLKDEESRKIFSIRAEYAIYHDIYDFIDNIYKYSYGCTMSSIFEEKYQKSEGIIIYGCGKEGKIAQKSLQACGYMIDFFCDRAIPSGSMVNGKKVISVDDAIRNYSSYLFVIGSTQYAREMYTNLLRLGITDEHIYISEVGMVSGFNEKRQYFDVLSAEDGEIFIDAGTYDGTTTENFMKWTNGTYEKIYCFEPLEIQSKRIERNINVGKWKNVELIKGAVWDRNETMMLYENNAGSCVDENGNTSIECVAIDEVIDSKVTYIKMDVEGAELKALQGAKKTIQKYKPKLAISIYHKPEDIFEIPVSILDMVPEYEFWIRHYSTNIWETVLYAQCKN